MTRSTSPRGLSIIKAHEGLRLKAYLCPAGVWTIGYGSTGPHVKPGMTITQMQADALLARDVRRFEDRVNRLVKVPITQGQFDALVSFDFNTGALHSSTLLKRLNAGKHSEVPAQLMRWTKGGGRELPGLVRRRREEAAMWRGLDEHATAGKADVAVVDAPKPPKSMAKSKTGAAATVAGLTGALAPINEAVRAARDTADGVSGLMAAGPWIILAVVIIGAAAFIWFDRKRKLEEDGV